MIVQVGALRFDFEASVDAAQYEANGACAAGWPAGHKVVDIVANGTKRCWLIEAKDFRVLTQPPQHANLKNLATTVDQKVRQTLAALAVYQTEGKDPTLVAHARAALAKEKKRVVLHLEPHTPGSVYSALFPKRFPALVLQKLKQLVKGIDPKPLVLSIASSPAARVPWTVT